jgi:small subunit ribosomal protein S11
MTEEKKDIKIDESLEEIKDIDNKNDQSLEDDSVDDDLFSDDDISKEENKNEIEDLPEEIKQKLEKNKQARSKKKLIKKRKKKELVKIKSGHAYINATYNNTIISLTDKTGNVISWASAGMAGFKGAKKATPYAAQIIAKIAVLKAKEEFGLEEVKVFVAGVGTGRESAIRSLNANGLIISSIKDVTAVPHNGCRPKKPRRV